jgi:hypothetical protein
MKETCLELFQQGIRLLNADRLSEAIEVFTRVIESPECEPEVKAQALNHRGFARFKEGDGVAATFDWHAVLGMSGVSEGQRTMAERAAYRVQVMGVRLTANSARISGNRDLAISGYSAILGDENAHDFEKFMAAQGLLAIPDIPDDLAEKARQFIERMLKTGQTPDRRPVSTSSCIQGCLLVIGVVVGGALALFFFAGLAWVMNFFAKR